MGGEEEEEREGRGRGEIKGRWNLPSLARGLWQVSHNSVSCAV